MAKGHKTGGRKAGTPNRKTQEVAEILATMGCDPVVILGRICLGEKIMANVGGIATEVLPSLDQRQRAASELAQYLHPKRRAVEHRQADDRNEIPSEDRIRILRDLLMRAGSDASGTALLQ